MANTILILLFGGAIAGLLQQIAGATTIAQRCLTLALFILCLDQTRMAIVDRLNIQTLQQRAITSGRSETNADSALQRFTWVTNTTIGLELLGFYLSWQWLGWGSAVVLLSQIWFNLFAAVQLAPESDPAIQPWGIKDRAIVLAADGLGLILSCGYALTIQPLAMAIGLLSMVLLYGLIKYPPAPIATLLAKQFKFVK
jgi:hypothetical protein